MMGMNWPGPVLIGIAALVALLLLISLGLALGMIEILVKPKGAQRRSFEQVRREQQELDGFDFAPYDNAPKEEFLLHGKDADIAGEFIPAQIPPGGAPGRPKCLIRVHGFSQNRLISVRFLGMFQEMGYSAVIYDQRRFGNSTGNICSFGLFERDDLSEVITWVKKRLGEGTFIALHGESMGAMTCLLALETDPRIDCVVADCGASNFYPAAGEMLKNLTRLPKFPILPLANLLMGRYGYRFSQVDPAAAVEKSDKPILFIHGTADQSIPASMSEEMYRRSKNPLSRLEIFEGAEHGYSYVRDPPRYVRAVQDFIRAAERAQG
ncbi:MAG: alpha/beta hydrolase [Spirochaetales bacterium]|jgi:pimeloyl-ACP methyl ester carboxylesterase|nr:alpha/beta hydrolase [Spirochaetales bacterium]